MQAKELVFLWSNWTFFDQTRYNKDSFCSLRGGSIFIRHQDLMHPSSESFSFGTLKDITLFLNSHLQQHNAKTKEQEKWDKERD